MFARVFALTPMPQPVPTATVTETVLVPTSMPTPIVNIPPDSVNWLSTLMEGFAGALIGAFLGGLAAVYVLRLSWANERKHGEAARRETSASELITVLEDLLLAIERSDGQQIGALDARLRLISTRLVRIYQSSENREFLDWMLSQSNDLRNGLKTAAQDSDQLNGLPKLKKYSLNRHTMYLRWGCIEWIRSADSWEVPEPNFWEKTELASSHPSPPAPS